MPKKWGSLLSFGFSIFFFCCAIYTNYYLDQLRQKLFIATLQKHSKESQLQSTSQWVRQENSILIGLSSETQPLSNFTDWLSENEWSYEIYNLKDEVSSVATSQSLWKSNTLHALRLMVLSEKSFKLRDYARCAEITSSLLKREAHVMQLLKGSLPKYVSNVYNVYNTRSLFTIDSYSMFRDAVKYNPSDHRQVYRGILYFRLYRCYSELSDFRRSRRNLELALEELGWEVVQNFMHGSSRKVLQGLHPRPYWSFVENLSYYASFDTNLLYGIMSVESGFDSTKISSAGACGLMQVMPLTAQSLSKSLTRSQLQRYGLNAEPKVGKGNMLNCRKLKDAYLNIHLASIFLEQLQSKYKEAHFVIASYNAGETAVRKWMQRSHKINKSFLSQVKFAETYRYIYKVLNDWLRYRSVYNGLGFTAQNVRYVN